MLFCSFKSVIQFRQYLAKAILQNNFTSKNNYNQHMGFIRRQEYDNECIMDLRSQHFFKLVFI